MDVTKAEAEIVISLFLPRSRPMPNVAQETYKMLS
jgi:hypothetical protein